MAKSIGEDDDVSQERQEYLDRRRRLKELERQKLSKGKTGSYANAGRESKEPKAGNQSNRGTGGSISKVGVRLAPSKEKKKLPYDRSFGSFFGPSEPVVAKRIIEEARAREEAEIVAARAAKASREESKASGEVERRRTSGASSSGKSSNDNIPSRRPAKPVDKVMEKARKLKEARDYSFLFDDSPMPDSKSMEEKVPAPSKAGGDARHEQSKLAFGRPDHTPARKPPLAPSRNGSVASVFDKPSSSSRPLQQQSKPSQQTRPLPSQSTRDTYPSQNRPKLASPAKSLSSKIFSGGSGRLDPKNETDLRKEAVKRGRLDSKTSADLRKEAVMRKLVGMSTTLNGSQSRVSDRHGPSQIKRASQAMDSRSTHAIDRHHAAHTTERRVPAQPSKAQPAAQTGNRRPVALQASERRSDVTQGLKKGAPARATDRPAVGGAEPRRQMLASETRRQSSQPKLGTKDLLRPASSDYNRGNIRRDESLRKRAQSLSEESDDHRPVKKKMVPAKTVQYGGRRRSPSEDDDDSFIDDDDDGANVSSMIHKLMGYNPNKYRGNDDYDDRSMEVGFRTIQAEELRSAREARLEDERELALIEAEEREEERRRRARKKRKLTNR